MPNGFDQEEPDLTLADLGVNVRFETGAERPSFYTDEQIGRLIPPPGEPPSQLDYELSRTAANRKFSASITREARESLGPNYCNLFPDAAVCASPPAAAGESFIRRTGAAGEPSFIQTRPAAALPPPRTRPPQAVDEWDFLRSWLAEDALLRRKDSLESLQRERAEAAADLARRAPELQRQAREEQYFALTPTERFNLGLTSFGGSGVRRRPTAGVGGR